MINIDKENNGGLYEKTDSIIYFIMLFATTFLFAVEIVEEKNYEYDISNTTKSIKVANLWVTEAFENPKEVVQLYDEDLNTLVINGTYMVWVMPIYFTLKIQVKGDKLVVKFNNFRYGTAKLKLDKTTIGLSDFYNKLDELAESLNQYYINF